MGWFSNIGESYIAGGFSLFILYCQTAVHVSNIPKNLMEERIEELLQRTFDLEKILDSLDISNNPFGFGFLQLRSFHFRNRLM